MVDAGATARIKTSIQLPASAIKPEPCLLKTGSPQSSKPADKSLVASAQKQPECLTVELGDALLQVFKTITDRH
jgi:hypothetical protein